MASKTGSAARVSKIRTSGASRRKRIRKKLRILRQGFSRIETSGAFLTLSPKVRLQRPLNQAKATIPKKATNRAIKIRPQSGAKS